MGKIIIWLFILIVLATGGWYLYKMSMQSSHSVVPTEISPIPTTMNPTTAVLSPMTTQTQNTTSYCSPQDLQANLSLSPGAGNVYGTFTLKNISQANCQVLGNNFIAANYNTTTVKNITIMHEGITQSAPFQLSPNQTIYSQVHYPNGPQCQGSTVATPVTFTYKISPTDTVTFANQTGNKTQNVMTCATSDITTIEIWQISLMPITP